MTKDIAVIGLACRFPGASSADAFWSNLVAGVNSIREIPRDRWDYEVYTQQTANKWGGFLEGIADFDAGFFEISPREACHMDPQQRVLLEVAWHCVEQSGVAPALLRSQRTGVYMGAMAMDYLQTATAPGVAVDGFACLGSYSCILSNRISHALGLSGPSVTIDTACSSSLVALHLARQALLVGDCDLAFVGGVSLNHHPWKHLCFSQARMLSPTGQCRTFDANADGYVPGEGCGVLLLQPLEQAIAANNRILGIIKGSAVNHSAVGESITAPSVERQTALLQTAYRTTGVSPATVTYIEAHGTGTSLGDPIEMEALTRAFAPHAPRPGYCKVGSVKTNIGHLEAAAGIAGVVKVLLMMQAKTIPPSLNLAMPNPLIDFTASPFIPAVDLAPWTAAADELPLRAGVSSFGFGGSNAHVVLEAPPAIRVAPAVLNTDQPPVALPFLLSAKSARSLEQLVMLWRVSGERLFQEFDLKDICANLARGRESFPWRFGVIVSSWADVQRALEQFVPSEEIPSVSRSSVDQDNALDVPSVSSLVGATALPETDFATVLQYARVLWGRQITFTRFVEVWREALRGDGVDLDALFADREPSEEQRLAVFLAIRSSLRRLSRKWDLTDRYPTGSPSLDRLVQLLADGALEPAAALDLLAGRAVSIDSTPLPDHESPFQAIPTALEDALAHWRAGEPVEWQDCFPQPYIKLSLPLYPFDRQTYWLNPVEGRSPVESSSIARCFRADDPVLAAHCLNGRFILPAASLAWFALDAAQQAMGKAVSLSDLEIHQAVPLPMEESSKTTGTVELSASVNRDESTLELHLKGKRIGGARITPLDGDDCLTDWTPQIWQQEEETEAIYAALRARGYHYGRPLQVIHSLVVNEEMAEFRLEAGDRTALLDGILQAAVYLRTLWDTSRAAIFEVPARIGRLFAQESLGTLQVRIARQDCQFSATGSRIGVTAIDSSGGLAIAIEALELAVAPLLSPEVTYFEPVWVATPSVAGNPAGTGRSLICAASAPLGLTLFQALRSRSADCHSILAGDRFERLGDNLYQMDFTAAQEYDRLLSMLAPLLSADPPTTPVTVYWVTRPLEALLPLEATVADRVAHGGRGVFLLLHAWTRYLHSTPLRLVAVTYDAQVVTDRDRGLGFASAGIEALARTAAIEVPHLRLKTIDLEATLSLEERSQILLAEATTAFDQDMVAYRGGQRYGRIIQERRDPSDPVSQIARGATLLVTGGAGALAAEVARAISSQIPVRLLLVGRSAPSLAVERLMAEIADLGSVAEYYQADVSDAIALERLVSQWRERDIQVQGVIHAAGQIEDSLLYNQSAAAFDRVLAPKLLAAVLLSQQLRDHPIEVFVAFSSITALTGNAGQANYAVANALLDAFCAARCRTAPGRSLTINWGLWQSRGMGATDSLAERFRRLGLEPLTAAAGRFALLDCLMTAVPQQAIVMGKGTAESVFKPRPEQPLSLSTPGEKLGRAELASNAVQSDLAIAAIEQELVELIARTLRAEPETISRQEGFFSLGIESLMIEEIMAELGKRYVGLRPTLLFDYPNITVLANYLSSRSGNRVSSGSPAVLPNPSGTQPATVAERLEPRAVAPRSPSTPVSRRAAGYEIAIIGLDGRYPQAPNLDTYWSNLKAGHSCVEEIPASRWDHMPYFSETKQPNRTYGKWGGFIDGVECFDPLFFNLSPREAEQTDPQLRLFLETVWHTMENAGYGSRASRQGQRVGLFAGVMWHDYSHVARDLSLSSDESSGAGSLFWAIANRVSHFLDLTGPSLAIDTACSSSLTAIHLACQSILMGECDMAVAGGVNLTLHPFRYLYLSQAGFLSKDGLCRSFGEGGEGYVPGEGVGAVLLKPLDRALADGDTIQGIIRGSSINHGGRANGFTVPNAIAQSQLIERSLQVAGVQFRDLQYIECHGTGTALGDPIEINALSQVAQRQGYVGERIPIGSVKSNIGHLEAAAGIAGVTKVLLGMRHGLIPATLHCQPPNPNISFAETPFEVTAQHRLWEPGAQPRIACVSSFGAGGSNAHVVLEDWYAPPTVPPIPTTEPRTIVLSARTQEQLEVLAGNLHQFLQSQPPSLDDLAWTLQVGREPLPERLALVTHSLTNLLEQLDAFVGGELQQGCFRGRASQGAQPVSANAEMSHEDRAARWTQGAAIDWTSQRAPGSRRVPLPGYPFARDRYWLTLPSEPPSPASVSPSSQDRDDRRLLTRAWLPEAISETLTEGRRLCVGVLTEGTAGNDLYRYLCTLPGIEYVQVKAADVPDWGTRLQELDAWVDAIDLDPTQPSLPSVSRLALYQSLLASVGQRPWRLLHVTSGAAANGNGTAIALRGAWIASLLPVLSCEHRSLRARTIAVDTNMMLPEIAEALHRELQFDSAHADVRYQAGRRYVADWQPLPLPQAQWSLDANRVYVVTGGTSGLGAEVATWLAAKGARKLLLLGVTALPPREYWSSNLSSYASAVQDRIRHIQSLEQSGVQVRLYAGKLTDRGRLQLFFDSSVRDLGTIAGVVHCAGVTPGSVGSFVRKDVRDILHTLEPKVEGLLTLADLVPPSSVDFFHLFSSVSAAVPALGAGVSDYACANGFLNAFAEVHRATGARITAINWPNWSGAGSARGESVRYQQLGFKTLTTEEALAFYETLAGSALPSVILPCTVDDSRFQVEQLALVLPSEPPTVTLPTSLPVSPIVADDVSVRTAGAIQEAWNWLADWFIRELKLPRHQLDGTTNFAEYGVDSILLADLSQAIEKRVGSPIDPSQLLELSTLNSLSEYLATHWTTPFEEAALQSTQSTGIGVGVKAVLTELAAANQIATRQPAINVDSVVHYPASSREIAVIGMGCHFPGAGNINEFWANLLAGVDSIREVPPSRWNHRLLYGNSNNGTLTSKWGGFLDNIEQFDASYFNIRDVAAAQVDPAIRQILEVFVETVRQAGYEEGELRGQTIGAFVGARAGSYPQRYSSWSKHSIVGAGQNFIASLSSHIFDWKGPSLVIDSACSSSLVAAHLACRSLLDEECSMAMAAGVDILLDEQPYRILSEAKALSPDGRCHTFDLRANGFVPGEGCGAVLLKRLDRALADGDRIYAVIEGSAINNDGYTMGTTTPSLEGQQRVIEAAWRAAGVDKASVSYVEAHGTGTMLGDPIELKALSRVIHQATTDKGFCAVGSVKTNIGHLLSAAGIAGLIKTVLAAWHGRIPPTLHCDQPNPRFDFANSPLFPCVQQQVWHPRQDVRRAGISSFGFGGTNCHVVLRDFSNTLAIPPRRSPLAPPQYQRQYAWLEKSPPEAENLPVVERRTTLLGFEEIVTR